MNTNYFELCRSIISDADELTMNVLNQLGIEVKNLTLKCPYHNDTNPSMTMKKFSDGKYHFKCWSSPDCPSGDLYMIVKHIKNFDHFSESVKYVCDIAGIETPDPGTHKIFNTETSVEDVISSIITYQNDHWDKILTKPCFESFNIDRKIPTNLLKKMRIIFLHEEELKVFLSTSDIAKLISTLSQTLTGSYLLDPLSCLIPMYNYLGHMDSAVIYAPNSPKHKSKYITIRGSNKEGEKFQTYFNEYMGFKNAKIQKTIFVCEGVIDCLSLMKAGFENTIALLGVSYSHTKLLNFLTTSNITTIYLALDDDKAGNSKINDILTDLAVENDIYIFKPNPLKTTHIIKDVDEYINLVGSSFRGVDLKKYILSAFTNIHIYSTQITMLKTAMTDYDKMVDLMDDFIHKIVSFNKNENASIQMIKEMYEFIENGYIVPYSMQYYIDLYLKRIFPTLQGEGNKLAGELIKVVSNIRKSLTFGELELIVLSIRTKMDDILKSINQDSHIHNIADYLQQNTKEFYDHKRTSNNDVYQLHSPVNKLLYKNIPKGDGWTIMVSGASGSGKSIGTYNLVADVLYSNPEDTTVIWLCLDDSRNTGDNKFAPVLWNIFNDNNKVPTINYKHINGNHFLRCSSLMQNLQQNRSLYILDTETITKHFKANITLPDILDKVITKHFLNNNAVVKPNIILFIDSITSVKGFSEAKQGDDSSEWELLKSWSNIHHICVISVNEITKQNYDKGIIPLSTMAKGSSKNIFKSDIVVLLHNLTTEKAKLDELSAWDIQVKIPFVEVYKRATFHSTKDSVIANLHKHKNEANTNTVGINYIMINNLYGTLELMPTSLRGLLQDYNKSIKQGHGK